MRLGGITPSGGSPPARPDTEEPSLASSPLHGSRWLLRMDEAGCQKVEAFTGWAEPSHRSPTGAYFALC
jgi:hypothetical protein